MVSSRCMQASRSALGDGVLGCASNGRFSMSSQGSKDTPDRRQGSDQGSSQFSFAVSSDIPSILYCFQYQRRCLWPSKIVRELRGYGTSTLVLRNLVRWRLLPFQSQGSHPSTDPTLSYSATLTRLDAIPRKSPSRATLRQEPDIAPPGTNRAESSITML